MPFSKPISFFIFFWMLFFSTGWAQKRVSLLSKKYPPATLQKDAGILRDVILKMHPAIGIYQPLAFYDTLFSKYVNGLDDSLSEKQFRLKTKLVTEELHCGHTEVIYSKAYYKSVRKEKLNYSPYVFMPINNKVYVFANLNKKIDSTLKKGTEILSINHVSVDSLQKHCKRFISVDGFNNTAKNYYLQLGFNVYFTALFGRPDTFEVEYKTANASKILKYPAFKASSLPPLPLGAKDDSLFSRYKKAAMRYRFLEPDNKTMLLKIEKFSRKGSKHAYRKIFTKLKKNKTQNLIIDLRSNGGGSLENSYRLLSYLLDSARTHTLSTCIKNYPFKKYTRGNILFKFTRFVFLIIGKKQSRHDTDNFVYTIKPNRKNHYSNKIYVLTNGGSFSASCLVGAYLKFKQRAVFIGEETGGAIEGCNAGITPYYKLPNTKIKVRIPAFRLINDVSPQITGRGILPDYPITYSIKDILARRDLELIKVKELIEP
jgi:hypothetical protein